MIFYYRRIEGLNNDKRDCCVKFANWNIISDCDKSAIRYFFHNISRLLITVEKLVTWKAIIDKVPCSNILREYGHNNTSLDDIIWVIIFALLFNNVIHISVDISFTPQTYGGIEWAPSNLKRKTCRKSKPREYVPFAYLNSFASNCTQCCCYIGRSANTHATMYQVIPPCLQYSQYIRSVCLH